MSETGSTPGTIAVTGATGRQGGAVARRLLGEGWRVRGLTRDAAGAKAQRLRGAGVKVVQADMADRDSLVAAFSGAAGVYSVQNPMICGHAGEIAQGRNVVDAALAVGAGHIVYGSAGPGEERTGVAQWDAKLEIEQHARRQGAPLTSLRPMAFMELMTDKAFYPNVSVWYVMPKLVGWDRALPWVSVDDLAAVAVAVFGRRDEFVGRTLPVAADTRTLDECRASWREATGRPPRRMPMPVKLFERFVGEDTTRMWRWLRDHPVDIDGTAARDLHPEMRTVRRWLGERVGSGRSTAGEVR